MVCNDFMCSGYAVARCVESPNAMAAVRSGQGCLTLCGDKRDLWLPNFLTPKDSSGLLSVEYESKSLRHETSENNDSIEVASQPECTSPHGASYPSRRPVKRHIRTSLMGKTATKRQLLQ